MFLSAIRYMDKNVVMSVRAFCSLWLFWFLNPSPEGVETWEGFNSSAIFMENNGCFKGDCNSNGSY